MSKELLAILDLPPEERWIKIRLHLINTESKHNLPIWRGPAHGHRFLANLAFRLRDEAAKNNITLFQRAIDLVFLKMNESHWAEEHPFARWPAVLAWFTHKGPPIAWIIAALIAKEMADA